MPNRSITDEEIALIKAMLRRGMKNKDIQFFFNRPDRAVNSGRITGIGDGSYSDSGSIKEASDLELDAFLAGFKATEVSAAVDVPAPAAVAPRSGPIDQDVLAAMFGRDNIGTWRFLHGESDAHECKKAFGLKFAHLWLRAVAALANNRGGYVVFGVHDRDDKKEGGIDLSYTVVGLTGEAPFSVNPVEITKKLKSTFDPTPRFQVAKIDIDGKSVGVLYVEQHPGRPVIATKADGDHIKEGDIFFRYPGQSSRIKYSDLRSLLDERDLQARKSVLPMVERLLQLGPSRAMIADLDAGTLGDGQTAIHIDEDLVKKIQFIREGEFEEKSGAPTLRLVGDVTVVEGREFVKREIVTGADLIRDFLDQSVPYDPEEYIRCAVEASQMSWLPIHYFARKAGLSNEQFAALIFGHSGSATRKKLFCDKISGTVTAYKKAKGSDERHIAAMLSKGCIPAVATETEARKISMAIIGLTSRPPLAIDAVLALLKECAAVLDGEERAMFMSVLRRAICRIDELYFGQGT